MTVTPLPATKSAITIFRMSVVLPDLTDVLYQFDREYNSALRPKRDRASVFPFACILAWGGPARTGVQAERERVYRQSLDAVRSPAVSKIRQAKGDSVSFGV